MRDRYLYARSGLKLSMEVGWINHGSIEHDDTLWRVQPAYLPIQKSRNTTTPCGESSQLTCQYKSLGTRRPRCPQRRSDLRFYPPLAQHSVALRRLELYPRRLQRSIRLSPYACQRRHDSHASRKASRKRRADSRCVRWRACVISGALRVP